MNPFLNRYVTPLDLSCLLHSYRNLHYRSPRVSSNQIVDLHMAAKSSSPPYAISGLEITTLRQHWALPEGPEPY